MPSPGRLLASRWRHLLVLLPLGAAVGFLVGWMFRDLLFGGVTGIVLGAALGLLLAARNPK